MQHRRTGARPYPQNIQIAVWAAVIVFVVVVFRKLRISRVNGGMGWIRMKG
jgi:hypothetical protein